MNRPIKFRAWDKDRNRFIYATLGDWYFDVTHHADGKMHGDEDGTELEEIKDSLQGWKQFTGLLDKNGKEIYEGDIVQGTVRFPQLLTWDTDENSNFKMAGSVFYDHHSFELKAIQSMCNPERDGMVNYFSFIGDDGEILDEMEIVGNIYENSDLLV